MNKAGERIRQAGDPLADFEATRRIALRVKDGRILDLGPPPPEPSVAED